MKPAIRQILKKLKLLKLDCLLITSEANISYLSGITSRDAFLLITKDKLYYLTDSRYTEEAKSKLNREFKVIKITGAAFLQISKLLKSIKAKEAGFEENHITFYAYNKLKTQLKGINLIPTLNLVETLRMVKTELELKLIQKSLQIAMLTFNHIQGFIKPGINELEVAAELESFIRKQGGRKASFEIIVASGPNSSYPHHITSERKIRANEPVLIDMGVDYAGYKSDLTRVFFFGKLSVHAQKIKSIVLGAQKQAILKIKPGVKISEIDAAGRQFIAQKGYGGYFGHSLGHGVGLEVHEAPGISAKNEGWLKPGMVFTVEPGIYLPGKFGVRIEDMVQVTKKGVKVLSGSLNK